MVSGGRTLERIGLQLYTIRSVLRDDVDGVLGKVAEMGYDEVELFNFTAEGYYGKSPAEMRALLEQLGMTTPATHVSMQPLRDNLDGLIEAAHTIGHQYLICPWLAPDDRRTIDDYKRHAAFFNEVGRKCREAGIRFGYHNHDFEFKAIDGRIPYDVLLDETDASLVMMEMDLYWIIKGGQDPLAYFERHPGRFHLCHVKDMAGGETMVDVGQGDIDFASIFAQSEQAGLIHYFVEHDNPEDPLRSIETSYTFLKQLQF